MRQKLTRTLKEVRAELASGAPLSAEHRSALEEILEQIEPLLESEQASDEHESLAERLREAAAEFEESHPNLTLAVGAVADTLSRMGL